MQDHALSIASVIEHAASFHPNREIVSRLVEGGTRRTTYREVRVRAKQAARALDALGLAAGERVGTLAWNTHRHLELYFAVPGSGRVLHTINPRLFPEQLAYIINHAGDTALYFDASFAPLVAQLVPQLTTVKHYVVMADSSQPLEADIPGLRYHEDLIRGIEVADYRWPEVDERAAAAICYTSGTTGHPKGVVYSHRSTVLCAMAVTAPDAFGLRAADSILLVVPMFHANAWGMPYSAAMVGAKLVLIGPQVDGRTIYELMRDEGVTFSQAVPTVWMMLLDHVDRERIDARSLALERLCAGGAAVSGGMVERFARDFDAHLSPGWGMTETNAIGVLNAPLPQHADLPEDRRREIGLHQGRGVFGVSLKITDEDGRPQPWDGASLGHLHVRGPWIANAYHGQAPGAALDAEGWLPTGDIATINADGYVKLVDRAKDVIKSGGEWISSVELERLAGAHLEVAEAACIGVPHPKWQERPLLLVVRRHGATVTREALMAHLAERVAKWWLPDEIVFVESLPHTGTGKLSKIELRRQYAGALGGA